MESSLQPALSRCSAMRGGRLRAFFPIGGLTIRIDRLTDRGGVSCVLMADGNSHALSEIFRGSSGREAVAPTTAGRPASRQAA